MISVIAPVMSGNVCKKGTLRLDRTGDEIEISRVDQLDQ